MKPFGSRAVGMDMHLRVIGVLVALVTTAHSKSFATRASPTDTTQTTRETSALELGALGTAFTFEMLRVAIRTGPRGATAHLTMTIRQSRQSFDSTFSVGQLKLPLTLPAGARVTGAAVKIGSMKRLVASALPAPQARAEFDRLLDMVEHPDPILVEQTARTADRTEIGIYVFPVSIDAPATIELVVALPAVETLAIESRSTIGVTHAGGKRWRPGDDIVVPVPAMRGAVNDAAEPPQVDEATSFYAGFPPGEEPRRRPIVIACSFGTAVYRVALNKAAIRRTIKQHRAQLERCYTKVVEYRGGAEGTVALSFAVAQSGRVDSVETSGELDDPRITSCIADEVRSWTFHPNDDYTRINYPITFKLAKSSVGERVH